MFFFPAVLFLTFKMKITIDLALKLNMILQSESNAKGKAMKPWGFENLNNKRWKKEGLYEKAVNLFNETKEAGYPMTDDDSLLGLLMLCTPKSFYKHIGLSLV